MQVQLNIDLEQLLRIIKTLPEEQLLLLKQELDMEARTEKPKASLEELLLNGPTATKKQLKVIANNRRAINQWRKG